MSSFIWTGLNFDFICNYYTIGLMEDLNKTQIILLSIFITLVTATATGVITVTLLDQAPPGITQTVNRVVERTVERVVSPGKIETTEIKQIIKEDDAIVDSIKRTRQSLVRITREDEIYLGVDNILPESMQASLQVSETTKDFVVSEVLALNNSEMTRNGFFVSNDGLIITSSDIVGSGEPTYKVSLYDGTKLSVKFLKSDKDLGISLFKILDEDKSKVKIVSLTSLSGEHLSLGQTILVPGSESGLSSVSIGYVSSYRSGNASSSSVVKTSLKTNSDWGGMPVLDIDGYLIGAYGVRGNVVTYAEIRSFIDSSIVKEDSSIVNL